MALHNRENVDEILNCDESFDEVVEVVEVEEEEVAEGQHPSSSQNVKCDVMDPFFYAQVNLETVNRDHTICHHCGEDLTNRRFYNHLFDYHGYSKQQLDVMKTQKRLETCRRKRKATDKLNLLECECGLQFVTKNGLNSHKLKVHDIVPNDEDKHTQSDNIVCPSYGCELNFSTYMDLAIHVDSFHRNLVTVSDAFRIRRTIFENKLTFLKWKRYMEKQTSSEFFLRTTQKVTFANRTMLFKCLYSNSRGQPKGRRCEQCPAFIRCCERNSGKYEVVACFGHLGHEHDTETSEARDLREMKWREIEEKVQSIYQPSSAQEGEHVDNGVVVVGEEVWQKDDGLEGEHGYLDGDQPDYEEE